MKIFDVAIVGGGLIGVASAFELAGKGLRVVVLDRQQPGREASWAAAGMLAPGPDASASKALVELGRESFELYPQFVEAIEEESAGKAASFARPGTVEAFCGPFAEQRRDEFIAGHHRFGLKAEAITPESARKMEPVLGPAVGAAAWLAEEATVDPRQLVDAALEASRKRGVEIRPDSAITSLLLSGDRCEGVTTSDEKISAQHTLITAGCFSGRMDREIARRAPTKPVRGQMLALCPTGPGPARVLRSEKGYLVPRPDGRVIAGSTLEDAGFEKAVTPDGAQKILRAALELVPSLAAAEIVEKWAGLRPGTPDDLPILGPTEIRGLSVATGHYRNGILLAPVTAKLVAEWITTGRAAPGIETFSPLRLRNVAGEAATRKTVAP
ncbi:MAG TPA: glycine oxidase ThiO [Candidatus Limnocylindrales bacterium]|nr:glycine oxidase ThiO [Candidatus Limnocylindrales bacterium]